MNQPHTHDAADTVSGTFTLQRVPQGSGSGLNADLLDGFDSSAFLKVGAPVPGLEVLAPLVGAGSAASPLQVSRASSSGDGYLASSDFDAFASKVQKVTAGAGLEVTGSATEPHVSAKFGAAAGTVTQGDDSRLSDARTPLPGSSHYIQNQAATATGQSASFSINGNAAVGGWSYVGANMAIGAPGQNERLLVNGDVRVGSYGVAAVGSAGPGPALVFSGGPTLNASHGSENSDLLSIARYNVSSDVTELRVTVGDNGQTRPGNNGLYDRFVIGAHDYGTTGWYAAFSVETSGTVRSRGSMVANSTPDLAETIAATSEVEVADVVCADPTHAERITRCLPGAKHVLGVVSDGTSSFLINAYGKTTDAQLTGKPLVLAGRVPVKVSGENGPVRIGDALGPSSVPGVAMKAAGAGPIVGVALGGFDGKLGQVLCFVSPGQGNLGEVVDELRAQNASLTQRLERLERLAESKL